MNENEMERYFWRSGQRWSGEYRSVDELRARRRRKLSIRAPILLALSFLIASLTILFWRQF